MSRVKALIEQLNKNTSLTLALVEEIAKKKSKTSNAIARSRSTAAMKHVESVRPPGYLTTLEAAARLGLSRNGVQSRMDRGELPYVEREFATPSGKIYFIKEEDVEASPRGRQIKGGKERKKEVVSRELPDKEFFNLPEAATFLGMSVEGVRHRVLRGDLEAEILEHGSLRHFRISREALLSQPSKSPRGRPSASSAKPTADAANAAREEIEDLAKLARSVNRVHSIADKMDALSARRGDR